MSYPNDRGFTEYVHEKIAMEKIYKQLGWTKLKLDEEEKNKLDIEKGIDRIFQTKEGDIVTVQERFRTENYKNYNDFTIRYTRENNPNDNRKKSEFFKIEADYFVYGITNCKDNSDRKCKDFIKFIVLDYRIIKEMIDDGKIMISENLEKNTSEIQNGIIKVPIKTNWDGSSEFIPIQIDHLKKSSELCKKYKNVIVLQKGFFNE